MSSLLTFNFQGSDETIENYAQFKKDVQTLYESTPSDFQKWVDYGATSLSSNVKPYQKVGRRLVVDKPLYLLPF